jgi:hypothetical protein
MTSPFEVGQISFSLQQCVVAANNGDGTFGAGWQIPSAKTLNLTYKYIQDRAEGNSRITAMAAQIIGVEWTLDTAGIDSQTLAILTGETPANSGSGGTAERYITFSNDLMPYFAIQAQGWADGGGDTLIFLPFNKVMTGFTWQFAFGKLVVPQFKGEAIADPNKAYEIIQVIERKTRNQTLVFPPT